MNDVQTIAENLYLLYKEYKGTCIDELRMHKLLYFAQKESLLVSNKPLFSEEFEAWRYGPVMKCVREMFKNHEFSLQALNVSSDIIDILKSVVQKYANVSSWELSEISHNEYAWRKARANLPDNASSTTKISLDDMRIDVEFERMFA